MAAPAEGPYLGEQMARKMKLEIVVVTEAVTRHKEEDDVWDHCRH
jgi:hypothetical protein